MQNKFFKFALYLLFALALMQIFGLNQPKKTDTTNVDVVIESPDSFKDGKPVIVTLKNQLDTPIQIDAYCPEEPLTVEHYVNGEWVQKTATTEQHCTDIGTVEGGESVQIDYSHWNHDLFGEPGEYRISYTMTTGEKTKTFFKQFEMKPLSFLGRINRELFYRPIFNTLIFFIDRLPNHSIAWSVILLTIVIRLILLMPNQRALKAQKAMQKVQPELDAIRKKYADNQQVMAQKTMEVWKKHKVSPTSSCLPMLIQLPILLSLFFVVRNGLSSFNPDLLYNGLQSFDPSIINPIFLGVLDVTEVNWQVLPLVIGGLQFIQIKLSFARNSGGNQPLPMMNQIMPIMMPAMIAIFTATLPAAVAFYWGTSTLFAIGQQLVVNRSK